MAVLWTDGTWTTAYAVGNPVFSCPIPGVNVAYLLTQTYYQTLADWSAVAIGTAHGTYTDYQLVEETPREDLGGGMVKWNRIYAKVPADHNEFETYAYNFIGYYGAWGVNVVTVDGRDRFVRAVVCKILTQYQATATPESSITITPETKYYIGTGDIITDFLADSPPFTVASTPSRTTYEGWVSTDAGTAGSYSIVVEPTRISRWMGNIWKKETRYVKAI